MSLSKTYNPKVTTSQLTIRSMAIYCAMLTCHLSVMAQPLQTLDSLPPTQWRSVSRNPESDTATPLMPAPVGHRLRPVTRVVSQQYSEAESVDSDKQSEPSLRAQLQRQKQIKIQEISRRLQQVLQVGPNCEPADSQASQTSTKILKSETSPFLPPIPRPDDGSSPTARTMPEQVNSGGMKDGNREVDGVPIPNERLPLLPEVGAIKPVVDASGKPEADTTGPPSTVPSSEITPSVELTQTDSNMPDEASDQSPEPAVAPKSSTGMPEISKMIDSLVQEENIGTDRVAEEAAVESPMSATTVLDTPVDRLRLSDSLFATKEFSLALQMYESIEAKDLPESERYWVTYQKASCLRRLNAIGEAQGIYRQLAGDASAGWLARLSRWWLDRISDRNELQTEVDKVASILNAVQEVKNAETTE